MKSKKTIWIIAIIVIVVLVVAGFFVAGNSNNTTKQDSVKSEKVHNKKHHKKAKKDQEKVADTTDSNETTTENSKKTTTNSTKTAPNSNNATGSKSQTSESLPASIQGDYARGLTIDGGLISMGTKESAIQIHAVKKVGNVYYIAGDSITENGGTVASATMSTPEHITITVNASGSVTIAGARNGNLNGTFSK